MRKFLLALALVAGFLVPVTVLTTATPAQAAINCGPLLDRLGDENESAVDTGSPGGALKHGWQRGKVWYKNCWDGDGPRFIRVFEYNVLLRQDDDNCNNMDDWHYDPNAIGDWNPEPRRSISCREAPQGDTVSGSVAWDHPTGFTRVNAGDPANERCIAAEAVAGIFPGGDYSIKDVPTICFFN